MYLEDIKRKCRKCVNFCIKRIKEREYEWCKVFNCSLDDITWDNCPAFRPKS